MDDAVQLQHYIRARQQFLELQHLAKSQAITAVASTGRNNFKVGSSGGIEGHGIQVDAVNKSFQGEKTRKLIGGHVTGKIQFKTALVVALINAAIWGFEDLL